MTEDAEYQKKLDEYRALLVDSEKKTSESFLKTLLTLSGGALIITFSYAKDVTNVNEPIFLLTSWIAWVISVLSVLITFYTSSAAHKYAREELDKGKLNNSNPGGIYTEIIIITEALGVFAFILGLIVFIWFIYGNLKI